MQARGQLPAYTSLNANLFRDHNPLNCEVAMREASAELAIGVGGTFAECSRNCTYAADGSVMAAACHLGWCAAINADIKFTVISL